MLEKISNGHISATGRPINFMFGSRVGNLGKVDLMALFSGRTNPRWRPPPSWIISNGHISATAHTIYLYIVHRAVIFAIAQLHCLLLLPARRYASAGLCESTCPPVCPSVTRRYCVKTKKASAMISSPSGSPTIVVF